jgi:tubulin polyglutamylase TTLL4
MIRALNLQQPVAGATTSATASCSDTADFEDGGSGSSDEDDDDVDPLEPVVGEVRCVPSLFPAGRPSTIYFDYPLSLRELGITRKKGHPGSDFSVEDLKNRKIFYKCVWERNCVKSAFMRAGFRRKISGQIWNCGWVKHPTTEGFEALNRFQKVNHFPGSWCIGRKDRLMRCINRAKRSIGPGYGNDAENEFDIIPGGWILPTEYDAWARTAASSKNNIYILKPSASSCGRGIRLIHKNNLNTVPKDKPCVMQQYLAAPYLIDKKKFDLRIYVLVTSFDPLKVYVFQEGLCRFSSSDYNLKKLNSRYSHLTNYSINKKSKNFVEPTVDNNTDMEGGKWSLTALWRYLLAKEGSKAVKKCQSQVKRLLVKTLVAAEGEIAPLVHRHIKNPGSCFELFGFDVFLDKALRPWLIEVNISPSLMGSSPLDQKIKGTLMADCFHLIGNVPYDEAALKGDGVKERIRRMSGNYKSKKGSSRLNQELWRRNPTSPGSVNLHELSEDDWGQIFDLEDEFARRGHFTRLFPAAEHMDLLCYFQSPRFNNALLASWLVNGRSSYVKNSHILANGDAKARDQLIKFADKKNAAEAQKASRAPKSSFVPGASEGQVAPPFVFVPGHNCAESRCILPAIEDDDSSSWFVPLGSRTEAVARAEIEALEKCTSGGDGLEGVDDEDDEDYDTEARSEVEKPAPKKETAKAKRPASASKKVTASAVAAAAKKADSSRSISTISTASVSSAGSGSGGSGNNSGMSSPTAGLNAEKLLADQISSQQHQQQHVVQQQRSIFTPQLLVPQERVTLSAASKMRQQHQMPPKPLSARGTAPVTMKPNIVSAGSFDGRKQSAAGQQQPRVERTSVSRQMYSQHQKQQQSLQQRQQQEQKQYADIFNDAKLLIAQHLQQVGVGSPAPAPKKGHHQRYK